MVQDTDAAVDVHNVWSWISDAAVRYVNGRDYCNEVNSYPYAILGVFVLNFVCCQTQKPTIITLKICLLFCIHIERFCEPPKIF
jgi:hypothetical protein